MAEEKETEGEKGSKKGLKRRDGRDERKHPRNKFLVTALYKPHDKRRGLAFITRFSYTPTNNFLVTYGALQVLYCIVLYCIHVSPH